MQKKSLSQSIVIFSLIAIASATPLAYSAPDLQDKTAITTKLLSKYQSLSVTVNDHGKDAKYSGVSVRSLLAEQVPEINTMSDWKKLAKDRLVVEVTGEDGFPALIPATELAMNQSGDKFVLATECDGKPLADGIRLICPQDEHHVRWVKQVASMSLIHMPQP